MRSRSLSSMASCEPGSRTVFLLIRRRRGRISNRAAPTSLRSLLTTVLADLGGVRQRKRPSCLDSESYRGRQTSIPSSDPGTASKLKTYLASLAGFAPASVSPRRTINKATSEPFCHQDDRSLRDGRSSAYLGRSDASSRIIGQSRRRATRISNLTHGDIRAAGESMRTTRWDLRRCHITRTCSHRRGPGRRQ